MSIQEFVCRALAEFIVVPGASHAINREQPEALNRHVLEFIHKH